MPLAAWRAFLPDYPFPFWDILGTLVACCICRGLKWRCMFVFPRFRIWLVAGFKLFLVSNWFQFSFRSSFSSQKCVPILSSWCISNISILAMGSNSRGRTRRRVEWLRNFVLGKRAATRNQQNWCVCWDNSRCRRIHLTWNSKFTAYRGIQISCLWDEWILVR